MKKNIFLICAIILMGTHIFAQPNVWENRGIGGGGALFSPSISPHNHSEIYMACDMTEIFHTQDFGETWEVVPFTELLATQESKIQYTSNPSILFAIHHNFAADTRIPKKSTDGGNTWTNIYDPTSGEVLYLFADPNSSTRVLLATWDQIYFSNDGGISFDAVYTAPDVYIGGVFWNGGNIFIGCKDGLLVSTNGGLNFSKQNYAGLSANYGFISFTGATDGTTTRLFGVARSKNVLWGLMQPSEYWDTQDVYRLDWDGTPTWQLANSGIPTNAFPFFVDMARNNPNVVYVAGATDVPQNPMIYKSTNAGDSWTSIYQTTNNTNITTGWIGAGGDLDWGWAENAMGFDVCDTNADVAIITDWGFAHVTDNGGQTWQQTYVDIDDQHSSGSTTPTQQYYLSNGLENTSSWWIHWTDANNMMAAYTDIAALRSNDGGQKWSFDYDGYAVEYSSGGKWNSTYHMVAATDGTLYAAVASVHDIYQSTYLHDSQLDNGDGAILKSTDNGNTWTLLHDFDMPVVRLALHPNDNNALYACVVHSTQGGIYKTSNLNAASPVFVPTAIPGRTEGHPYDIKVLNDGTLVAAYSGRRDSAWAFTASSGIFTSTNDGTSWSDVSDNGMHYWTKDIIIDPHDNNQNTWYAAVHSGWGGAPNGLGGLYKTTNRGQSWNKIVNLDRVESATIHPTDPNIMYVTTEFEGLWYTDDLNNSAGATFSLLDEYRFQHPMRVFFNPYNTDEVWLTSFGHGMSMGNVDVTSLTQVGNDSGIDIYPNPFVDNINFDTKGKTNLVIINIEGKRVYETVFHGKKNLDLSYLPDGIYSCLIHQKNKTYHQKVIKLNSK